MGHSCCEATALILLIKQEKEKQPVFLVSRNLRTFREGLEGPEDSTLPRKGFFHFIVSLLLYKETSLLRSTAKILVLLVNDAKMRFTDL